MKANINNIREKISLACKNSNRDENEIFLLPVSKTVDIKKIEEAIDLGFNTFGENKVQEILKKYEYFEGKIKFHMIGHLQTNKVKSIIDKVELIHSLDRISLLDKLEAEAKNKGIVVNCLVEVNIGKEESKSGIFEEDVLDFIKEVSKRDNVFVNGLMTVAPCCENAEETRVYFKKMKSLFDEISKLNFKNIDMKILSMGMSNDYTVAIEEGATLIRIGTSIFGKRDYGVVSK
ncbi:pyridoxal phosphate enzyme, YggS family [Parvimonas sp. oral taxon 393 str. F0440]|nr:pyridoxal phosphate enzyme, YggS family [Parvimonas sp. oral taxon 393 str. F0440]